MLKKAFTIFLFFVSMIWTEAGATTMVRRVQNLRFSVATGLLIVKGATSKSASDRGHICQRRSSPKPKPLEAPPPSGLLAKPLGATTQSDTTPKPVEAPAQKNTTAKNLEATTQSNFTGHSDKDIWLSEHNRIRALYGSPPLTWDTTLEAFAQTVSDKCKFEHTQNGKYGENLAGGWPPLNGVTNWWVSAPGEKDAWDPDHPDGSHFTQVIWKRTTRLGCAGTNCNNLSGYPGSKGYMMWVCEYICDDPRGYGTYAENIQARKGGEPAV